MRVDRGTSDELTSYPICDHPAGRHPVPVSRYPFLDHPAGRHPVPVGQGGPCTADRFTSFTGGLLPIALFGCTSVMVSTPIFAFSDRVVEAHQPVLVQALRPELAVLDLAQHERDLRLAELLSRHRSLHHLAHQS